MPTFSRYFGHQQLLGHGCHLLRLAEGSCDPYFQGGFKRLTNSCRLTNLTSMLLKVCEHNNRDSVYANLHTNQFLHCAQYGFLAGRSCLLHLSRITSINALAEMNVDACFLEFDFVNHCIFYMELESLKIQLESSQTDT